MTSVGKVKLPPVSQVGIVVRDIQKAADYYTATFGIGPFSIIDVNMEGVLLRGKPSSSKIKAAFAQSGALQIEFIQPVEGQNLYTEFLATNGEGLHHLGFQVEDFDGMVAAFAKEGIKPIFYQRMEAFAFAYLGTERIGGVIIELIWTKRRDKTKA